MRRVVITGLGVVAPNGIGKERFWQANIQGASSVDLIKSFDPSRYQTKIAAEVKDFDPLKYMNELTAGKADRFSQFVIASAKMAINDGKLNIGNFSNIGISIGTGLGGMFFYEKQILRMYEYGPKRVHPASVPSVMPNSPSGKLAIELNLTGPNLTTATACSSSTHAIGQAYDLIRLGRTDIVLAGGTEATIIPYTFAAFDTLKVMSKRNDSPKEASRPFDKERDGMVMGEGAAVLILEELQSALKRNAHIYAEIIGYGANSGAYHMVIPKPEAEDTANVMVEALKDANLKPEQIDYINAHGTSTVSNDKAETLAIKKVFGDYACKIPISSTKSMVGHTIGAAGAIEAVVCSLVIENNIIPPTINYKYKDPDCDLDYVPNDARQKQVNTVLSNSFGFGSNNACLIINRYKG